LEPSTSQDCGVSDMHKSWYCNWLYSRKVVSKNGRYLLFPWQ